MLDSLHAAAILLYGPLLAYVVLTAAAGICAVARRPLPAWFWPLSLIALILVVVQGGTGVVLFLVGARPPRSLHVLYGLLVVAAGVIHYGLRPQGFFRRTFARELAWGEARTLALISLTQAALIGRGWMTGLGG